MMRHDVLRESLCPLLSVVFAMVIGHGRAVAHEPNEARRPTPILGCGKARAMAYGFAAETAHENPGTASGRGSGNGPREAFQDTDLLHCNLELEIDPASANNMAGTNTMTIQSKSPALTQFTFRLRNQYNISSIIANAGTPQSTPVTFTTPGTTTRVVTLDRAYGLDEVFTLTIAYDGPAVSRGFGSIDFGLHNGADIVSTLSEPYYSYTWWPIKDGDVGQPGDNGDKFTLDLAIIAPDTMVTASNGLLQGIDFLSGSRARYRWSSGYPICPYLVCFSSTNYNTWQVDYVPIAGGTMPVLFYIYPEHDTSGNRAAWEQVVPMLVTLRDLYGEYPFVNEKYGIYESPFGGGMEHQTFTAQGTFSETVTVHELGHQWWGDMITAKTWNHIWINEGFASYTEALWAENKPGSSGLTALKNTMAAKRYTGAGSVYVTNGELGSLGAIFDGNTTYNKAAWVLHMLRHVLGDGNFFNALGAYRAAFEFSAATTEDFQAVCEGFYPGGDLNWFFQEWIYGERTPAYAYGWQNVQVHGKDYLLLYLDQTQSGSYQRFVMPVDLVVDGTTHVVFNDSDPEHFVVPIAAPASTVQLDPDEWVLTSGKTTTAYVAGPAKIVETSPLPGATVPCGAAPGAISVWFQTNVDAAPAAFSVTGQNTGTQTFTLASGSNVNPVVLNLDAPLLADTYTLVVTTGVTAVNSGQPLDGEIADAADPASLPSGDGVAGGDAVILFTVTGAATSGDIDGDCDIDSNDLSLFINALLGDTTEPFYSNSDLDGSGLPPNGEDIQPFVAAYLGP